MTWQFCPREGIELLAAYWSPFGPYQQLEFLDFELQCNLHRNPSVILHLGSLECWTWPKLNLSGPLPHSFRDIHKSSEIDLSNNHLDWRIPSSSLRVRETSLDRYTEQLAQQGPFPLKFTASQSQTTRLNTPETLPAIRPPQEIGEPPSGNRYRFIPSGRESSDG